MFKIDGTEYNGTACIVDGISETFTMLEGVQKQRTQAKTMWYNVIGCESVFTVNLRRDDSLPIADWESLWSMLRNPSSGTGNGNHYFEFPGMAPFEGHINTATSAIDFVDGSTVYRGDFSLVIEPTSPQN